MEQRELEKLDVKPYIGTKTKIENATVINTQYGLAVKVETYPLADLKEGKKLRASCILAIMTDDDGINFIGIDTKLHKFLMSKKVLIETIPDVVEGSSVLELHDKDVIVQLNARTGFLDLI